MRRGSNPAIEIYQLPPYSTHRIIVPVYIPEQSGWFEQMSEIMQMSIESLHHTTAGRAEITVIANGCAKEVVACLDEMRDKDWIDQLIINHTNRGKIDAVVAAMRGSFADLITVSDCDVLFLPGWIEAIEKIFVNFPECGMVSPFPGPFQMWTHTASTLLDAFLKRILHFESVVSEADFDLFAQGIELDHNAKYRKQQLVVRRANAVACVGCGHMVATLRREVLKYMPKQPSLIALQGIADRNWIDEPPDKGGYWRLSTPQTYVYHMGNRLDPTAKRLIEELPKDQAGPQAVSIPRPTFSISRLVPYGFRIFFLRFLHFGLKIRSSGQK